MISQPERWNSELYQSSHSFVWQYGRDLLVLLDAKPGERVLDLGCGTGQLTAEIAQAGAEAVGIDASPEMIATARRNFPQVQFEVANVSSLTYTNEFDAGVSNAALHWVRDQPGAISSIAHALKPGGRFVFEMGGHGNLRRAVEAAFQALRSLGIADPQRCLTWYFPSIAEYASLLESHGFEVSFAVLFDRPTLLEHGEGGFTKWIEMFGKFALSAVPEKDRDELVRRWDQLARPALFRNGVWTVDYKRLRMLAIKQ